MSSSHDTNLVGNIQSILVTGQSNVCLLFSSWSVKGVNFLNLDLVKLLTGLLDHLFVSSLVHNKDERVVVLNGFDSGFACKRVLDHSVLVKSVLPLDSSEEDLCASLLN